MKQVTNFQFNRNAYGYVRHVNKWVWPIYDWESHDSSDFERKDHVKAQAIRTGVMTITEESHACTS